MKSGVEEIIWTREGVTILWDETIFESGQVYRTYRSGMVLAMRDGAHWFHDYSGGAPRQIQVRE